jgi:hypothetical protein
MIVRPITEGVESFSKNKYVFWLRTSLSSNSKRIMKEKN